MLKALRKLLGWNPPLHGLEQLLEETKQGNISTEDAAERIRDLAARPNIPRWILYYFRFVGVLFPIVGIGIGIYGVWFSIGKEKTTGTVVEMRGIGMRGIEMQPPVVEYNVDGKPYTVVGSVSSSPPAFAVGDEVPVLYDPDDPSTARIDTFRERWLFPLVFTFGGLFALMISFAMPHIVAFLTGRKVTTG